MKHDLTRARYQCTHCEDVIQSSHRHDFVWCECKHIYVDGGKDYTRLGYPAEPRDYWIRVLPGEAA